MKSLFRLVILSLLLINLGVNTKVDEVYAEQKFGSTIKTDYYLQEDGIVKVDQRVTLENLTAESFATQYGMVVYTDDLESVVARDSLGNILEDYQKVDEQTQISLKFNEEAVGLGAELKFRISYTTNSLFKDQGRIKEISIPASPDSDSINNYTAVLHIPSRYSKTRHYKPAPAQLDENAALWTNMELEEIGATVFIGESQYYKVSLKYELANDGLTTVTRGITIPPDTAYQKVTLNSINPKPENVILDQDGNWVAEYKLSAKDSLEIVVDLVIETFIEPRDGFPTQSVDKKAYLAEQEYWEVNDPELNRKGKELKKIEDIYNYVATHLSYNYQKVVDEGGRVGAKVADVDATNAICTEFTDLFIALSRAANIPAREVNGYAYASDPNTQPLSLVLELLHAWPEYYDHKLNLWKPVDPTWGNTTGGVDYFNSLDYNHLTFVQRGISSTSPLSAGMFQNVEATDFINVELLDKLPETKVEDIKLELDLPASSPAGREVVGYLVITNPNMIALLNVLVNLESHPVKVVTPLTTVDVLPPLATVRVPFKLAASYNLETVDNTVRASYRDLIVEQNIVIANWKELLKPYLMGVVVGSVVLLIVALFIRARLWKRR